MEFFVRFVIGGLIVSASAALRKSGG